MPTPGDYGCVPIAGDVGRGIALGQMAFRRLAKDAYPDSVAWRYQHAFVYVDDGVIVEAEPGGAVRRPLHYDNVLWSTVPLTDVQRQDICAAAVGLIGVPYSFADYVAIALHGLHVPAPGLRTFIADSSHMICSQLTDYAYWKAGVHLFQDSRWPGYVLPADLAQLALKDAHGA